MTLHRLLADYRKTLRRLRRRAQSSSFRQVQAWQRRLASLATRLGLAPRLRLRHAALAAAMLGLSASAMAQGSITGNAKFFGRSDGNVSLPLYDSSSDYAVAALGDIDGDGDLDAVVQSEYYGKFFRNVGTRKQAVWQEESSPSSPFYSILSSYSYSEYSSHALIDIDGDGDQDYVFGYGLRFFENTGTKTNAVFTQRYGAANPFAGVQSDTYAATYYYYNRFTFGDFDADGDIDLVNTPGGYWQYYGLKFYKNTGSKTSPSFELQSGAADPFASLSIDECLYPVAGDFDKDGDLDIVVARYYNYDDLRFIKNVGSASAPSFSDDGALSGLYISDPVLSGGDIDGDGDVDLLQGNDQEWIVTLENVNGRFSQAVIGDYISDQDQIVDIDNDGDLDFAGTGWFNLTNDNGVMQYVGYGSFGANNDNGWTFFDIDNDGDKDLVEWNGAVPVLNRNAGGVFTADYSATGPFYNTTSSGMYGTVWGNAGDMDSDGDVDLVMFTTGGSHRYFRNDAGAFVLETGGTDPFYNVGSSDQKPYLVDIDGDGDRDLISFDTNNGTNHEVWRNDAPGTPLVQLTGADNPLQGVVINDGFGSGTDMIYAVDIDRDGDLDFRFFSSDYNEWMVLTNNLPKYGRVDGIAAGKAKILVGPVPAKTGDQLCLYVDRPTDDLEVTVFNAAGETVSTGFLGGTNGCMTATMAPGLYWARIKSEGRTFTQKLIINAR